MFHMKQNFNIIIKKRDMSSFGHIPSFFYVYILEAECSATKNYIYIIYSPLVEKTKRMPRFGAPLFIHG